MNRPQTLFTTVAAAAFAFAAGLAGCQTQEPRAEHQQFQDPPPVQQPQQSPQTPDEYR